MLRKPILNSLSSPNIIKLIFVQWIINSFNLINRINFQALTSQIEQTLEQSDASSSSILSSVLSSSTVTSQSDNQNNVNRNFIHIQHHQHHLQSPSAHQSNVRSHSSHYHHNHNSHTNQESISSKPTSQHQRSSNVTTDNNSLDNSGIHQQQQQQQPQLPPPQQPQQIFINQSNNIYILAKYGQTVYLPCLVYKQNHFDLSNVHVIWHRLYDRLIIYPNFLKEYPNKSNKNKFRVIQIFLTFRKWVMD
jgi:DNA mismatch repair ATPase MutL